MGRARVQAWLVAGRALGPPQPHIPTPADSPAVPMGWIRAAAVALLLCILALVNPVVGMQLPLTKGRFGALKKLLVHVGSVHPSTNVEQWSELSGVHALSLEHTRTTLCPSELMLCINAVRCRYGVA